ncbi:MAG: hypothetical protein V4662_10635 [Verrucomicrobiota bacterium]
MSVLSKRILTTLAVLAVACAQVFGVVRGYACEHGEAVTETEAEHCHRAAADDDTYYVPCEEDSTKECENKGEQEHHSPLSVDMKASPSSFAMVSIPVFVAVLIADSWVQDWVMIRTLAENELTKMPLDTGGGSPPASLQVARCMVILV